MKGSLRSVLLGATLLLAAANAAAHPDHGSASFSAGLAHPVGGLDHLLAMLAVGLWSAAALPPRRRIIAPALFVVLLVAGAWVGHGLPAVRFLEPALGASVLLLGALLLLPSRVSVAAGLALVAFAALAHGYAHGLEMAGASAAAYGAGLALASALLHAAGLGLGAWLRRLRAWLWQAIAASVTATGALMLATRI